jgi:hypothetical protein
MTINTILWTLSYEPIRKAHPREEVEKDLNVALQCIHIASERWPGVESALALYKTLVAACLRIYDREGDVDISAGSPIDSTNIGSSVGSPAESPGAGTSFRYASPVSSGTVPPSELNSRLANSSAAATATASAAVAGIAGQNTSEQQQHNGGYPFFQQTPTSSHQHSLPPFTDTATLSPYSAFSNPSGAMSNRSGSARSSMEYHDASSAVAATETNNLPLFQPHAPEQQLPLPTTFGNMSGWNPDFDFTTASPRVNVPALAPYDPTPSLSDFASPSASPPHSQANHHHQFGSGGSTSSFPGGGGGGGGAEQQPQLQHPGESRGSAPQDGYPQWADYYFTPPSALEATGQNRDEYGFGLTEREQMELMESLSASGPGAIQNIVDATNKVFYPESRFR